MERVHCKRLAVLALALATGLGAGAAARAGSTRTASPTVDVQSAASLAPDGGSMTVQVLASCPERWSVVEAVVAVSQPKASGQAPFPLTCTGSLRMFGVVVPSSGGTFELGDAQATATVVVERGRTARAEDAQVVSVQPQVVVDLADNAQLESGGGAVTIAVTVACPTGASGQASYVNVSQGQTTGSGAYVPTCNGSAHTFSVRVEARSGTYAAGNAAALTFATVEYGGVAFSGVAEKQVQIASM